MEVLMKLALKFWKITRKTLMIKSAFYKVVD